jgi:hypothetical protein
MQQAVEHRADRGGVAQQFAPILDRTIGRQQRAGALVAAHDDLQQIFGRGERQFAHPEIVDDQQRDRGERVHVLLARAVENGFGEFLEQHVRLAVEHAIALHEGGVANRLRQVALARSAQARNIMPMVPRASRFTTRFTLSTVRAFAFNGG